MSSGIGGHVRRNLTVDSRQDGESLVTGITDVTLMLYTASRNKLCNFLKSAYRRHTFFIIDRGGSGGGGLYQAEAPPRRLESALFAKVPFLF